LNIPPVTTAQNIVSGCDADLTNILIQQFSVIVYAHNLKTTEKSESKSDTNVRRSVSVERHIPSWPVEAKVLLSVDGTTWVREELLKPALKNEFQSQWLKLTEPCFAKFVRIVPLKWEHDKSVESAGPALRVSVRAEKSLDGQDIKFAPNYLLESAEIVLEALKAIQNVAATIVSTIEYVDKLETSFHEFKQDQLRKVP